MSGDQVAAQLGWSASKISRIETYRTGVKQADLLALLDLYHVDEVHRSQLVALADEQEGRGWWAAYADSLPEDFAAYLSLEAEAVSILCWSPEVVHGLLQTEEYARAVIEKHMYATVPIPKRELRRRIEARMRRQDVLADSSPTQLTFLLDEAVLLRKVGTRAIMQAQLARLAELARLPHVTLRVLSLAGEHPIGTGGFAILQFAPVHGTELGDLVYVEQLVRNSYVEDPGEALQYQLAYDRLSAAALDPSASSALIGRIAADWGP